MKAFEYFRPNTIEEAIEILSQWGEVAVAFAGGTDLLVRMKDRHLTPKCLVDIKGIPGLDVIKYDEHEGLTLGSMVSFRDIEKSEVIRRNYPILVQGAEIVGSFQIRNRGSIGGNLCNAAPSADIVPPLIVLGAVAI